MVRWLFLFGVSVFFIGCGDESESGNQLICESGTCSSACDANLQESCNVTCREGTTCDATCNAGQECQFNCEGSADCTFDCAQGNCTIQGGSENCSCTGNCLGTCGSTPPGEMKSCDECDPSAPDFQACLASCVE